MRVLSGVRLVVGVLCAVVLVHALQPAEETRASVREGVAYSDETSLNWAGYAAVDGEYTSVSGTWTIPAVESVGEANAYAAWVGIGGVKTSDLIQAGTAAIEDEWGAIDYFAWFETLPAAAIPIPMDVAPGDSITVHVQEEFPDEWIISIINNTTEDELHIPIRYRSSRTSAEWIQERPMIGADELTHLSDFEPIVFMDGVTRKNGQVLSIYESGAQKISMANSFGDALAVPTVLDATGSSFSVSRTEEGIAEGPFIASERNSQQPTVIVITLGAFSASIPLPSFDVRWPRVDLLPHV